MGSGRRAADGIKRLSTGLVARLQTWLPWPLDGPDSLGEQHVMPYRDGDGGGLVEVGARPDGVAAE